MHGAAGNAIAHAPVGTLLNPDHFRRDGDSVLRLNCHWDHNVADWNHKVTACSSSGIGDVALCHELAGLSFDSA
jgi:hypothetical protein